jgi:NAD(P)-dependent dehydrogenase (short-subunit alcohol dehydrogenase family)
MGSRKIASPASAAEISLGGLAALPSQALGRESRSIGNADHMQRFRRLMGSPATKISGRVRRPAKRKCTMGKLQDKVAVITGGTQGIGLATAKLFASEGAYVFITGRRQKELEEAVAAIGRNVTGVQGDVANLADLDRLYERVKAKGGIDVLFANVGLGGFVPLGSITEAYYDKTFDTNVKGLLFTVQKALPFLNDGASVILTGSAAAAKGTPSFGVYAASKAAIRSFVRTWTVELKDRRIRSNVLSPGPVVTPQVALQPPEAIARIVSTVPMGRMAEPEEIARVALFLGSDDSSFITGIELFADGGRAQV